MGISTTYYTPWAQQPSTFNTGFNWGNYSPSTFNPNWGNFSSTPSTWGSISSGGNSASSTSTSDLTLEEYQELEKKESAKKRKEKEGAEIKEGSSKLIPEVGLTKKHDEALQKLLKQMKNDGCDTPLVEYAMSHGSEAMELMLWAPIAKGACNFVGGSATGQALYKYSGAKWVAGKCGKGYQAVRNIKGIKQTGDFITKHGIHKVDVAARNVAIRRAAAGESAKWRLKASATSTKACASGVRAIAKYGGAFEAGMTIYDDKDKLVTAWKKDSSTGWKQTGQTAAKATAAGVGFWAGAKGGAMLGASIGSIFGPVGTGVGGFLGGLIGGIAGSWGAKKLAEQAVGKDAALTIQEEKLTKENIKNGELLQQMCAYVEKVGAKNIDPVALEALQILAQGSQGSQANQQQLQKIA